MYKEINEFFESKAIAIVGASRSKNSFSLNLLRVFAKRGFKVYAVNPNAKSIEGVESYPSLMQLPNDVDAVYIIKRKDIAIDLAREAANKGIMKIWIHVNCDSPEIDELCKKYGVTIIVGECFFMWAEPVRGMHAFHRFLRKLFDRSIP